MAIQQLRRQLMTAAGAVSGISALAAIPGATAAHAEKEDPDLTVVGGSWREQVTPTDPSLSHFQVLLTFTAGGGMSATASIDFAPPTRSSPGYGAWVRVERRTYRFHVLAFALDAGGNSIGTVHVRERLRINDEGTAYSGTGSFQVLAANAQALLSGTFSVSATRIRAEAF